MATTTLNGLPAAAGPVFGTVAVPGSSQGTTYKFTASQLAGVFNVKDYGAAGDGSTDDTAAIRAAFNACLLSTGARVLYFPTGTYVTTITAGNLMSATVDWFTVLGDGAGLTVWKYADGTTLTGGTYLLSLTGSYNRLAGVSIQGGANVTLNGFNQEGVLWAAGSFRCTVSDCEAVGINGGTTAGATAFTHAQPWNQVEFTSTLGTNVTAATAPLCTPGSMNGLYLGRTVDVDSTVKVSLRAQRVTVGTGYAVGDLLNLSGGSLAAGGVASQWVVTQIQGVSAAPTSGQAGSGYQTGDVVALSGGTLAPGGSATRYNVTASGGAITSLTLNTAGSYTVSPGASAVSLTNVSGVGTGGKLDVAYGVNQVGNYGAVSVSSVAAGGSGYAVGDYIVLANATAGGYPTVLQVLTLSGNAVASASVVVPGTYASAPSNPIAQATTSGSGINATFNMSYTTAPNPIGAAVIPGAYSAPPAQSGSIATTSNGSGTGATVAVFFNAEQVVPFATTATAFRACFANAHSSSVSLTLSSDGRGYHTYENNYVHDCPLACAFLGTSGGARYRNNKIVNVGLLSTQHAFYDQGWGTEFIENFVQGVGGYSFHCHKSVPNMDGSGCTVIGNVSIDPGQAHFIFDNANSPIQITAGNNYQANPQIPLGGQVNRLCVIQGNYFKKTIQSVTGSQGFLSGVQGVVVGNIWEDGPTTTGQGWLSITSGDGTVVVGNTFRVLNQTTSNSFAVLVVSGAGVSVTGNTFVGFTGTGAGGCVGGPASGGFVCSDNTFQGSNTFTGTFVRLGGPSAVRGNRFAGGDTGNTGAKGVSFSALTGILICDNDFTQMSPNSTPFSIVAHATSQAWIYNNSWTGSVQGLRITGSGLPVNLNLMNNDGTVENGGVTGSPLSRQCGRLTPAITGATVTRDLAVKLDRTGAIIPVTTSDTVANAFAVSNNNSGSAVFCVSQPGAEYPSAQVDNQTTFGNVGILSTTSAGKWHDVGGPAPPGYQAALGASPVSGGTGYAVGDTVTLVSGVFGTAAVLTVASVASGTGAVLGTVISTAGNYTTPPPNVAVQGSTSASGTGAGFSVAWGQPSHVRFLENSSGGQARVQILKMS